MIGVGQNDLNTSPTTRYQGKKTCESCGHFWRLSLPPSLALHNGFMQHTPEPSNPYSQCSKNIHVHILAAMLCYSSPTYLYILLKLGRKMILCSSFRLSPNSGHHGIPARATMTGKPHDLSG